MQTFEVVEARLEVVQKLLQHVTVEVKLKHVQINDLFEMLKRLQCQVLEHLTVFEGFVEKEMKIEEELTKAKNEIKWMRDSLADSGWLTIKVLSMQILSRLTTKKTYDNIV